MFFVISGVSSSGKNTVMKELVKRVKNLEVLSKSSGTTRAPRESDKEFDTYVYFTAEEFEKSIKEGKFFEYEKVHENYYGLLKHQVEKAINNKKIDYIRDVDVKGNVTLRNAYKNKIYSIFIDAPDEILRERLKNRGDSPEDIELRLSRNELERSYKHHYDLVLDNIDLEKTLTTIETFINKVRNK